MTDEILKGEMLTDEQLDGVAGGTFKKLLVDILAMAVARKDSDNFQFRGIEPLRRE